MSEVAMPSLGKPGEPCQQCGAPLAADQRYCLNCGERRGGPRVDYRELGLGATAPPPPDAPAAKPEAEVKDAETKTERDYAPLAAVGGIAVLGLMLLVGVLIGRSDDDGGTAAAPVVIPSGATGTAGTEPTGTAGAGGEAGAGGDPASGGAKAGGAGNEKQANEEAREQAAGEGAVETSTAELEALENETGEDAAKNALKLPNKQVTPGEPPPIDKSVAPGGGEGGGLTIK